MPVIRPFIAVVSFVNLIFASLFSFFSKLKSLSLRVVLRQAVSLTLIISILGTSTFAAAPGVGTAMAVSINEIGKDIRFSYLSSSLAANFLSWETLGLIIKPFTGKKKQQAPEKVVILPGDITVVKGGRINFTALGLGSDQSPISGLQFKWTIQDTGRNQPPRPLNNGIFTAKTSGTFVVTAEALGRRAQVAVTVNQNDGYALDKILQKDEDARSEKEKQVVAELKGKGRLVTREISSKADYKEEEEKQLNQADKQKRNEAKAKQLERLQRNQNENQNPNQNPGVGNDGGMRPRGPNAEGEDRAEAEGVIDEAPAEAPAPESNLSSVEPTAAAAAARPVDEDGWNGDNLVAG